MDNPQKIIKKIGATSIMVIPGLICNEGDNPNNMHTISKVLTYDNYNYEKEVDEIIKSIDPDGIFFTRILTDCKLDERVLHLNKLEKTPGIEHIFNRNFITLTHDGYSIARLLDETLGKRKGDMDLVKVILNTINKNIFKFSYHLFFGLKKLHQIGILHSDIKPDNILVDTMVLDKPDYKIKDRGVYPKIIDYGSFKKITDDILEDKNKKIDNYDEEILSDLFAGTPLYKPPEFYGFFKLYGATAKEYLDRIQISREVKNLFLHPEPHLANMLNPRIMEKLVKFKLDNKDNREFNLDKILIKPDLFIKSKNIYSEKKDYLKNYYSKKDNYVNIFKLDIYAMGKTLLLLVDKIETIFKIEVDKQIKILILNCMNFDFVQRYNVDQCIEFLERFI